MNRDQKIIVISKAAKFLGVSIDTVRRYDKLGILHSTRPGGKIRYFDIQELKAVKSSKPFIAKSHMEGVPLRREASRRDSFHVRRRKMDSQVINAMNTCVTTVIPDFLTMSLLNEIRHLHKYLWIPTFGVIIALLLLLLFSTQAQPATGTNKQINFQGKVVNINGTNVTNGNYSFVFSLYTVSSGGSDIWTETKTLTVTDGIFRTALGSTTAFPGSVDFNTDNIYLGINFNSDGEMTPRVQFTAVPQAFNALKVAGLTVTDTTGTFTLADAKTLTVSNTLTFAGTDATSFTFPSTTGGTVITSNAPTQSITSTQTSGTVLSVSNSTGLEAAIKGQVITLSGANAFDQTGLEFNLSGATGANLNDIVGSGSTWKVSKAGVITVASCTGCSGGTTWNNITNPTGTQSLTFDDGELTAWTVNSNTETFQTITANSLTTGTGLYIASSSLSSGTLINLVITGTAGLTNQKGINVSLSGANGAGAQTTYGGYFSNTHTGTSTNVGLYATATGGTNNYAAIFAGGNVGIGTTTPTEKLSLAGGNFLHTASGNPTLKGTYDTTGNAYGVYVSGKYAYVADDLSGLQVIDISTPSSPTLVGTYNTSGNAYGVYVSGKYAYVADDGSGLQVIDISTPSNPTLVGTYDTSGLAREVYVSGKYAYVADYDSGLQVIDISTPSAPTLVGTYDTSGEAYGVYVSGKYAYVADVASGLQVIDISVPSSPTLVGTYNTSGLARGVYVSGKYAYVADQTSGLQVIDISTPSSPTLVGTYNTSGDAYGVYVSGKYAYVADIGPGLQVIDISTPSSPTLVGTYNTSDLAWGVYVSGKYAYVADGASGLQVIDINGIETPSLYAGNIATNGLTVTENADIANNLSIGNGLNVGSGGIFSAGTIALVSTDVSNSLIITANSVTTATSIKVNTTGLTTGNALEILGPSSTNLLTIGRTNQGFLDFARVSIGTSQQRDQLHVQGRINTTWDWIDESFLGSIAGGGAATAVTADTLVRSFVMDEITECGWRLQQSTGFSAIQARAGDAAATANDGCRTGSGGLVGLRKNENPVMETKVTMDSTAEHIVRIGFTSDAAGAAIQTEPVDGVFFRKTAAQTNWFCVTRATNTETAVDSATAISASGTFQTLRIEIENTADDGARFFINGTSVCSSPILTNIPTANLGWGNANAETNITVKNLSTDYIKVWQDAPPEGAGASAQATEAAPQAADMIESADVAEFYLGDPTILVPGTVVSLKDPTNSNETRPSVEKSQRAYDPRALGVVSTSPGLTLGNPGDEKAVEVALAGRVPVKVSTENGPIRAGDLLTSSSQLGVAMKATKAGRIIGQALTSYAGEEIGTVLMFIHNSYSQGSKLADILPGLTSTSEESEPTSEVSLGKLALAQFVAEREQLAQAVDLSEIVTDRVSAGLEVITLKLIASEVNLDSISAATGEDIALNLTSNGKFIIKDEEGQTAISFDSQGNAFFKGTVSADKVKANQIEGLEIFTNKLASLSEQVAGIATSSAVILGTSETRTPESGFLTSQNDPSTTLGAGNIVTLGNITFESGKVTLDLTVLGRLETQGGLIVGGPAEFKAPTLFEALVTFVQNVIFRGDVSFLGNVKYLSDITFQGRPTFNKDTAGFAVIYKDADTVEVVFEKEYAQIPLVNISITLDDLCHPELDSGSQDSLATPQNDNECKTKQETLEQAILSGDIRYIVTKRTTKGFIIKINKVAPDDVKFSWSALSVKDAKTFQSVILGTSEMRTPESDSGQAGMTASNPTPTPTSTPEASPSATLSDTPSAIPTSTATP